MRSKWPSTTKDPPSEIGKLAVRANVTRVDDTGRKARTVALLEELVDLSRETNQLLGELLNKSDSQPVGGAGQPSFEAQLPQLNNPARADESALAAAHALNGFEPGYEPETNVFWPRTARSPYGWVRVSVKHPSELSLRRRVEAGCLCGGKIVERETSDGERYLSCENVAKRDSCKHRPSANFERLTFLTNLPAAR